MDTFVSYCELLDVVAPDGLREPVTSDIMKPATPEVECPVAAARRSCWTVNSSYNLLPKRATVITRPPLFTE